MQGKFPTFCDIYKVELFKYLHRLHKNQNMYLVNVDVYCNIPDVFLIIFNIYFFFSEKVFSVIAQS